MASITVAGVTYPVEAHPTLFNTIRTVGTQAPNTFSDPFTGTVTINLVGGGTLDCDYVDNILPVELVSFEAEASDSSIMLSWQTATEDENEGFEVQRSANGVDFTSIGWVEGAGTTEQNQSYSFEDSNASSGLNFYRLLQRDYNGDTSFSKIVIADYSGASSLNVYPNPVRRGQALNVIGNNDAAYSIYNSTGQFVTRNERENTLETTTLASGFYFVVFDDGKRAKFVVN